MEREVAKRGNKNILRRLLGLVIVSVGAVSAIAWVILVPQFAGLGESVSEFVFVWSIVAAWALISASLVTGGVSLVKGKVVSPRAFRMLTIVTVVVSVLAIVMLLGCCG